MGLYAVLSGFDTDIDDPQYAFTATDARLYKRYQIMLKMGWSYQEYKDTPASVVSQIWAFIKTENKVKQEKAEENG